MSELYKDAKSLRHLLPSQKMQSGIRYVPSRFALPFTHAGKRYVFHTLTKQIRECELPSSCIARTGYDELVAEYYLVPCDMDEYAFYESVLALMKAYYKHTTKAYTILPTFSCNARCTYCFEEGFIPLSMTDATADQTVRYILANHCPGERVRLDWFGGEPLLGEKIIDRICRGLADAGVDYSSSMTSNGSLITPAVVEKMTGLWKLGGIQISMDSSEEDYRRRKRYLSYRNDYHRIMKEVSRMSDNGINVLVRCNVDMENISMIPQFLEDLRVGIENKENVCVYLSPLDQVRDSEENLEIWEEVIKLDDQIEAAGFRLSGFRRSNFNFRVFHCMADRGIPAISPDGGLYACEYFPKESRFGDVWHGITDPAARKEFCRTDRVREKCRDCTFLPFCTPFANCCSEDRYCREVERLFLSDMLQDRMEKSQQARIQPAEEIPGC